MFWLYCLFSIFMVNICGMDMLASIGVGSNMHRAQTWLQHMAGICWACSMEISVEKIWFFDHGSEPNTLGTWQGTGKRAFQKRRKCLYECERGGLENMLLGKKSSNFSIFFFYSNLVSCWENFYTFYNFLSFSINHAFSPHPPILLIWSWILICVGRYEGWG